MQNSIKTFNKNRSKRFSKRLFYYPAVATLRKLGFKPETYHLSVLQALQCALDNNMDIKPLVGLTELQIRAAIEAHNVGIDYVEYYTTKGFEHFQIELIVEALKNKLSFDCEVFRNAKNVFEARHIYNEIYAANNKKYSECIFVKETYNTNTIIRYVDSDGIKQKIRIKDAQNKTLELNMPLNYGWYKYAKCTKIYNDLYHIEFIVNNIDLFDKDEVYSMGCEVYLSLSYDCDKNTPCIDISCNGFNL